MSEERDIKEVIDDMDDKTNWTSIDLYYKGFHVKKSVPENVDFETVKKSIDKAIELGFEPSWNQETNKKQDPIMRATANEGKLLSCNFCGADAERKSGEKNGKKWSGIFCSENRDHVQWNA